MNNMIIGIDEKPKKWYQWILFSLQHFFAMFCANTLISLIIYQSYDLVPAALISAGIGTIIYLMITRFRSPVFLGSSAGLIGVMSAGLTVLSTENNFWGVIIGLTIVGIIYLIVAFIISKIGTNWLRKLLPPIITGPVIMVIGISLAVFAVNWSDYNVMNYIDQPFNIFGLLVALITLFTTTLVAHYGNKTIKTLPYLFGIIAGYVSSWIFTGLGYLFDQNMMILIDIAKFKDISWIPDFAFIKAIEQSAAIDWKSILSIAAVAIPISFVTICEHIGDHLNISSITGRNLLEDPGLAKTLAGDGLATIAGGFIGGMGNTTYGENSSVIAVSKVASSKVIFTGALTAILFGLCAPLMTIVKTIPICVFGGISLTIYGAIAISGLKQLQTIDFNNNKNLLIASVILVSGVGGLFIEIGTFKFSGVALAMVLGVILNLILKDKVNE